MFFQWHNNHKIIQKAIIRAVKSDRYTATQLKCMGDWWLRVSSSGYIGLLFLICSVSTSSVEPSGTVFAFGICMFTLSILFCWLGLCDCEAAKQKELLK